MKTTGWYFDFLVARDAAGLDAAGLVFLVWFSRCPTRPELKSNGSNCSTSSSLSKDFLMSNISMWSMFAGIGGLGRGSRMSEVAID